MSPSVKGQMNSAAESNWKGRLAVTAAVVITADLTLLSILAMAASDIDVFANALGRISVSAAIAAFGASRACRSSESKRRYSRLVGLIAAATVLLGFALWVFWVVAHAAAARAGSIDFQPAK